MIEFQKFTKIKDLEVRLGKKIKKNGSAIGIDTASRTGWALVKTTQNLIFFSYGVVDIQSKDRLFKYNKFIEFFEALFYNWANTKTTVVIEDTFFRHNPHMYAMISRFGAIVYTIAHLFGYKNKIFIRANSARAKIGLTGNAKKTQIQKQLKEKLNLDIEDKDVLDAIVLALCGLIEEMPKKTNKSKIKKLRGV